MSNPFLDWLSDILIIPGLPLAALIIGGYQAIWRDRRHFCFVLNVAVILIIGVLAILQPVDGAAPVPGMIVVLYMFLYLPAHLALLALIWGISFYRERRHDARQAKADGNDPTIRMFMLAPTSHIRHRRNDASETARVAFASGVRGRGAVCEART